MSETFDAGWLALRERFDAAARSPALAARFAAALPDAPVIADLGAGTGSLFRWLAPRIGRDQGWLLVDADAGLLETGLGAIAHWARARGHGVRPDGDGIAIETGAATWRVAARLADLAAIDRIGLAAADAVACSALLDLVSPRWIGALAARVRGPFLACLNVDGRDALLPRHAGDAAVRTGFRRDQARDKGFGPAAGRHAVAAVQAAFGARGFAVETAPSDWRIGAAEAEMLVALVHGHADAAARWMPSARGAIAAWERARVRQALAGRLAMRVGHRDVLALKQGGR